MTWQPLDLCHNTHLFDDITPFLGMTSHPLYVQYHITYIRHHTHILWDHTTLCMTSHAFFLDITPSISDTTSTLSVSSRPVHKLYHTNSLYAITHTLCMKSQSVCMTSHEHFMTSYPYRYDITHSILLWCYQYTVCDVIPIRLWSQKVFMWCHAYRLWFHT